MSKNKKTLINYSRLDRPLKGPIQAWFLTCSSKVIIDVKKMYPVEMGYFTYGFLTIRQVIWKNYNESS